jgi:hypothetical protein
VTFLFSIPWQENIAFYLFHRRAHFVVFLLTLIDVTLVLLLILRDFDIIDGKIIHLNMRQAYTLLSLRHT